MSGIAVTAPDGATINFPEGTNPATINNVMASYHAGALKPPAPASASQGGGYTPPAIANMASPPAAMQNIQGSTGAGAPLASLAMGLRSPIDAGAQMLAKAGSQFAPEGAIKDFFNSQGQSVAKDMAAAQSDYEKYSPDLSKAKIDPFKIAGQALTTLPIAYGMPGATAAGIIPRIASGIASGSAMGALQPVEPDSKDFWNDKLHQTIAQGAMGGAMPAATSTLARLISPNTSAAAQKLLGAGVTPTPGQLLGGMTNTLEQKATSLPVLGDTIATARARPVQQLNRAAINNSLFPIGEKLDPGTPLGHEAIQQARDKIGAVFDKTIPSLTSKIDASFATDMTQLAGMAQQMVPQRAQQFASIMQNQLVSKISPNGTLTGESAHEVQSEFGRLARQYHGSPDPDQRLMGDALQQAQSNVLDLIGRSNPQGATAFNNARLAYKNFMPVQRAASSIGAQEGVFSPAQLLSAVRGNDKSLNHSAFARGTATGQDFAEAGKSVLGGTVPDSGTGGRNAFWEVPAALGGLYMMHPGAAMGALAGGGGLMGAYSPIGQRIMATMLARRPAGARQAGQGLRFLAPALTAGLLAP